MGRRVNRLDLNAAAATWNDEVSSRRLREVALSLEKEPPAKNPVVYEVRTERPKEGCGLLRKIFLIAPGSFDGEPFQTLPEKLPGPGVVLGLRGEGEIVVGSETHKLTWGVTIPLSREEEFRARNLGSGDLVFLLLACPGKD